MRFLEIIGGWINRHFSHEEAIYLVVFLVGIFLILVTVGNVLAPVLTGLVLAFLLQGLLKRLIGWGVSPGAAVYLTFVVFLSALVALMLFVVPLVWQQLSALRSALPSIVLRLPVWISPGRARRSFSRPLASTRSSTLRCSRTIRSSTERATRATPMVEVASSFRAAPHLTARTR